LVKPLIHHRFPEEDECILSTSKRKRAFNPGEQCRKALYIDKGGKIYQPALHIESALIRGATAFSWKGRKTYKEIVASEVEVYPEKIYFEVPENPEDYTCFIVTAVNPINKSRTRVARPMWKDWQFTFYIKVYDPEAISGETLKKILVHAGRRIGIGTYRLRYGKFEVLKFEEIPDNSIPQ